MQDKKNNNVKPILTFEGKKYFIEELSEEIRDIIKNLQIADAQIKMHEDTLKFLTLGRSNLASELRKTLEKN